MSSWRRYSPMMHPTCRLNVASAVPVVAAASHAGPKTAGEASSVTIEEVPAATPSTPAVSRAAAPCSAAASPPPGAQGERTLPQVDPSQLREMASMMRTNPGMVQSHTSTMQNMSQAELDRLVRPAGAQLAQEASGYAQVAVVPGPLPCTESCGGSSRGQEQAPARLHVAACEEAAVLHPACLARQRSDVLATHRQAGRRHRLHKLRPAPSCCRLPLRGWRRGH